MATNKKNNLSNSFDITNFTFFRDLLLVKAIRPNSGKFIDPAQYEDKPEFGEVVKCGDKCEYIKVGDVVRFGKYSTESIRTNGADYFIVHEEDVSAKL